ncbi:hypothetical protein FA95DRAFT_1028888 [Auriscalpium vulgare]|uniref:Uncharacterized protein n=1 Tax=Auriscalpium vulgare TaxID=40419 RepID=A0ACB8R5W1_9AGAM|nr:hypothetical protein FA95DRAFT_1028888 [Auriscalpium vulgare]
MTPASSRSAQGHGTNDCLEGFVSLDHGRGGGVGMRTRKTAGLFGGGLEVLRLQRQRPACRQRRAGPLQPRVAVSFRSEAPSLPPVSFTVAPPPSRMSPLHSLSQPPRILFHQMMRPAALLQRLACSIISAAPFHYGAHCGTRLSPPAFVRREHSWHTALVKTRPRRDDSVGYMLTTSP